MTNEVFLCAVEAELKERNLSLSNCKSVLMKTLSKKVHSIHYFMIEEQ